MKLNRIFQILILFFLLFFLINSAYNYVLNNFLIKTEIIQESLFLKGYDTQGLIFAKEKLIKTDSDGPIKFLVSEGQRVSKLYPIAQRGGQNIVAPISGMVSFKYDGLEEIGDPFESTTFNFEEVKLNYSEIDSTGKNEFLRGDVILKIKDNLEKPKLYLELPITNFKEPLQVGQILSVKFPEEDGTLDVKIIKLKGIGQNALINLEFLNLPESYSRIQELKIVSEEIKTFLIPKKAMSVLNEKDGIYIVEKGIINFKEINIIGEDGDYFLADSLKTNTEIVLTPKFVSDGKYIR